MLYLSRSLSHSLEQVGVVKNWVEGSEGGWWDGGFTRGIYIGEHTHTYTRAHTFKVCFAIVKFFDCCEAAGAARCCCCCCCCTKFFYLFLVLVVTHTNTHTQRHGTQRGEVATGWWGVCVILTACWCCWCCLSCCLYYCCYCIYCCCCCPLQTWSGLVGI